MNSAYILGLSFEVQYNKTIVSMEYTLNDATCNFKFCVTMYAFKVKQDLT